MDEFASICLLLRTAPTASNTSNSAFSGDNVWAILRATEHDDPKPPHEINAAVPLPLSRLIRELLARDPAARPASAAAVIQALDAVTTDSPSDSADIPPTLTMPERPVIVPRPRRWHLAALTATVAILVLMRSFAALWPTPDPKPKKSPPSEDAALPLTLPLESPRLPTGQRFRVETIAARGRIAAIAFRPRTYQAATVSADGVLRFWDAKEGRLLRAVVPALPDRSDLRKSSLAWHPDGQTLVWALPSGTIYQIDPDTGRGKVLHENLGRIASLAWSADGQLLAVGLEGERREIRVWSRDGWLPPLRDANVSALTFSPDGKLLAAGGSEIWNIESGQLSPLSKGLPALAQTLPSCLAWSPDGATLAIGGLLWTKSNGKTRTFDSEGVAALQWFNEGKKLVLAKTSGEVIVHEIPAGKRDRRVVLQKLVGWITGPTALSFDGSSLASNPTNDCTFKLWDAVSGSLVGDFPGSIPVMTWRVSPNGHRLQTAAGDAFHLYETTTGKLLQLVRHRENAWLDGFSPDGKWLKAGEWVRDAETLKETYSVRGCWSAAWLPQSDRLAYITAQRKSVALLDLTNKQTRLVLPDVPVAYGLACSPDGEKLALTFLQFGAAIYDLKRGSKLLSLDIPGDVLHDVAWSLDGKLLAVVGEARAWICDAATGKVVKVIAEKDKIALTLAFSRDGKLLATVRSDGRVSVWDTRDWKERRLASLPVDALIGGPCWTDNDKTLLVSIGTAEIHSFDVTSGTRRGVCWPMNNARMLVVGSSGYYSGTPNIRRHLVYVVQTTEGQQTLTPDEFDEQFNWKNDPGKVEWLAK